MLSCENDINDINRIYASQSSNIEIITGVEILYSDSARLKVRITGDSLKRYQTPPELKDVFTHGVKFEFFDENGRLSSTLTAKKAERNYQRQQVICTDSVTFKGAKGEEIFTNELIWDEAKELIYTDKFVRLSRPNEVVYSYGFKSDQKLEKYELTAVSGVLDGKELQKNK
jgi:LPS export ABC transporter protein LptC